MNTLITVRLYSSHMEAEIAKGLLEANGIKAIITADYIGGYDPTSVTTGVELKVNSENLKKAKKLLEGKKS